MQRKTTISVKNWNALVEMNCEAVRAGWAEAGVFATGIGPHVKPDGLLYIGQSAGPLGADVGSDYEQSRSIAASTRWMVERLHPNSLFWHMADDLDPTRRNLAWTNVCKMDKRGGGEPPRKYWPHLSSAHIAALHDEMDALQPRVLLFVTGSFAEHEIQELIRDRGYKHSAILLQDGVRQAFELKDSIAIVTRHPRGWRKDKRDRVVALVKENLSEPASAA
ncbi:MAG: hypothetical protein HY245_16295 [Rhizobiales bacterium]|nr:hypothetical protein [Hyphomicrobiales bacterium]MBI3674943.1 hypothetical protein [Hyphomicrobiales bacterium]